MKGMLLRVCWLGHRSARKITPASTVDAQHVLSLDKYDASTGDAGKVIPAQVACAPHQR